jgi:MoaE-MoaD fusion protein
MKVKVLFFGFARDLTGFRQEEVELRDGEILSGLRRHYESRFPRLHEAAGSLQFAVNQEMADSSQTLREGDEVAFLPPVSGGAGDDIYRMTSNIISAAQLSRELAGPSDGAIATFEGIVRDNSHGRRVLYLEYEAYEPMARAKMEAIGAKLKSRFDISRIGMAHRTGRLEIGEVSVAIAVTAPHRAAAFDACRAAIDRLKQTVPIWKKEYFEDGAVWAEGEGQVRILAEAKAR